MPRAASGADRAAVGVPGSWGGLQGSWRAPADGRSVGGGALTSCGCSPMAVRGLDHPRVSSRGPEGGGAAPGAGRAVDVRVSGSCQRVTHRGCQKNSRLRPQERSQGHHMRTLRGWAPGEAGQQGDGSRELQPASLRPAQPCQPTQAFQVTGCLASPCHLLNFHSCFSLVFSISAFIRAHLIRGGSRGLSGALFPPCSSPANTLDTSSSA